MAVYQSCGKRSVCFDEYRHERKRQYIFQARNSSATDNTISSIRDIEFLQCRRSNRQLVGITLTQRSHVKHSQFYTTVRFSATFEFQNSTISYYFISIWWFTGAVVNGLFRRMPKTKTSVYIFRVRRV